MSKTDVLYRLLIGTINVWTNITNVFAKLKIAEYCWICLKRVIKNYVFEKELFCIFVKLSIVYYNNLKLMLKIKKNCIGCSEFFYFNKIKKSCIFA